ncbi:hypothetical protein C0995_014259 [Termitomyces sp. Mi166|nr:hypothetical protein C0995_014259 [Termitomyces sp. Mi166\
MKMPTTAAIQALVKTITALSSDLPLSVKQTREPGPSSIYEAELKKLKNDGGPGTEEGWNELLSDDKEEDNLDMGIDLDSD